MMLPRVCYTNDKIIYLSTYLIISLLKAESGRKRAKHAMLFDIDALDE